MRALSILALPLLLAGCASAPTHFYTLAPAPPAARLTAQPSLDPPIEVGDIPVPSVIDTNSIVLSAGDDRLDVSSQDQWGAPLGQLIRQALTADLIARLASGSVLAPGSPAPRSGLRVLSLQITRFMGDTAGHVALDVSWEIIKGGSSTVISRGQETIEVPAASGRIDAIVPAMSQALAQLADRLVSRLVV
jgi:uncharacterized protein